MSIPPTNGLARQQAMSQYPQSRSNTVQKEPEFKDSFYTDMVFGTRPGTFLPRQVSQNHAKADLRWGSDAGFGAADRFVPAVSQSKEIAAVEQSQIKALAEAFIDTSDLPSSADVTRSSSPTHARIHQRTRSIGRSYEDDENDPRAGKRRKSKYNDEDDDDESPGSGTYKNNNKKRKSTKSSGSPTESIEQANKRRKSNAAAAAKATRENLTEDQKRENHIKSEQKRRTLIREGFEDLGELVPGLRGGGFSKSAVLIMSAEWLEELMQGNEVLRQRLDQMQGR